MYSQLFCLDLLSKLKSYFSWFYEYYVIILIKSREYIEKLILSISSFEAMENFNVKTRKLSVFTQPFVVKIQFQIVCLAFYFFAIFCILYVMFDSQDLMHLN
jgi:hypothetical protein